MQTTPIYHDLTTLEHRLSNDEDPELLLTSVEALLKKLTGFRVADSRLRGLLVVERWLQALWTSGNFSPVSSVNLSVVKQLIRHGFLTDEYNDRKVPWFGGAVVDLTKTHFAAKHQVLQFSCELMILALQKEIDAEEAGALLTRVAAVFDGNPFELVYCLMDNDDRVLFCLLAWHRISSWWQNAPFSIGELFIVLTHLSSYSESLFIEWLSSELVSIPVFNRILPSVSGDQLDVLFCKLASQKHLASIQNRLSQATLKLDTGSSAGTDKLKNCPQPFVLKLNELHGGEKAVRTVTLTPVLHPSATTGTATFPATLDRKRFLLTLRNFKTKLTLLSSDFSFNVRPILLKLPS